MLNKVEDTKKRIAMLVSRKKKTADKAKLAKIDSELVLLNASIEQMEGMRDKAREEYAKMNQEDASKQVTKRATELAEIDARITKAKAAAEWENKQIAKEEASLKTAKGDAIAAHKKIIEAARTRLGGHVKFLAGIATVRADLAAEYESQKNKQDEAETLLSNAAEKRAN